MTLVIYAGKSLRRIEERVAVPSQRYVISLVGCSARQRLVVVQPAAESGIIKVKTIAARNTDILAALKENSSEVVQPFLMGCGTKEPKITQLCLAAIQRLMSHEVVSEAAAGNIINMLWQLMENSLEELKLLQTVLVLLTTNTVVHDEALSKILLFEGATLFTHL
nr:PREDICTED: protein MON2 homolog [Haliaeetus albicilla]